MPRLSVGDIFSVQYTNWNQTSTLEHWKVTAINKIWNDDFKYQVIRCSKTGKEFRKTNSFSTNIDKHFGVPLDGWSYNIVKQGSTVGDKANIDSGIESGKLQRRLNHCAAKADAYIKEIHSIREKLGYSDKLTEWFPTDQQHSMWNLCRLE